LESVPGFANGPDEDEPGRVNVDMEFEDAMRVMLNTDLRESGDHRYICPDDGVREPGKDRQVRM
jgi:hypothetical protein